MTTYKDRRLGNFIEINLLLVQMKFKRRSGNYQG